MFHDLGVAGGSVAFWEQAWREGDYTESARYCDVDPLGPILDRYAHRGSVLLEGGCGRGAYVAHLSARGVRALGLDFAMGTLSDVRNHYPNLLLAAGDVAQLPLRDGCVDTYYSGGVVEHFESGPHGAIAEAKRVLKPNGVLLISVPYFSPLRRILVPLRRGDWRRVAVHGTGRAPSERVFFQYAYRPGEFSQILAGHGLRVIDQRGYSIVWGLYELPVIGRLLRCAARLEPPTATVAFDAPESPIAPAGPARTSLLKRLIVIEDDEIPVVGWIVRLLRWLAANMMMYVCIPNEVSRR